ncbi:MAG: hypothetical protein ACI4LH_04335 [Candidatus Heritagella sp.]
MEKNSQETGFHYIYSAREQEEIQKIRQKYLPPQENKMEQLRRLDRRVTQKGTAAALSAGILGALILGIGLCCITVWAGEWFLPGIPIGLAGMALMGAAYPLYHRITEKDRKKMAPQILRLADELTK